MNPVTAAIERITGCPVDRLSPLSGGSICAVHRVDAGNRTWCLKQRDDAPKDFFAAEAAGLSALGISGHVRIPTVIHATRDFLLLEWLPPRAPCQADERQLGRALAALHGEPCDSFGFAADNYCGLTPQINSPTADGHEFFARCRLIPLGERALQAGLLDPGDLQRLYRVAGDLRRWIPSQVPSLIHGDLWRGNIHFCENGPALIDPACHRGWGEADLAMTQLFGALSRDFYAAYREVRPLEPGYEERTSLYNLYHLLNHLNLFGAGWLDQVRSVLNRYA